MSEPKSNSFPGTTVVGELRRELDRLFQEILAASETLERPSWSPPTDILELPEAFVVMVEAPGMKADELEVSIDGNRLRIEGRRRLAFPRSGGVRFHCLERREGGFGRQIEIFQPVDFSLATARLQRGLLRVTLPKLQERRRRARTIPVEHDPSEDET